MHTADELGDAGGGRGAHGVRVLSDEIHAPLVYATSTFTPYLTVPGSERGITVTSASKAWNLAGLKAALVVPGGDARADVARLHPFVTFGASHFGVIAQTAAYQTAAPGSTSSSTSSTPTARCSPSLVREQLPGARLSAPRVHLPGLARPAPARSR